MCVCVPKLVSQPHLPCPPCAHPPPQLTEKLLDLENENMMRVAELEKQLLQREKELEVVKVCVGVVRRDGAAVGCAEEGAAGSRPSPPPPKPGTCCPPRRPASTGASSCTPCGG